MYDRLDVDSDDWRYMLEVSLREKALADELASLVLVDHDERHDGSAQWCTALACRKASDRLRRTA